MARGESDRRSHFWRATGLPRLWAPCGLQMAAAVAPTLGAALLCGLLGARAQPSPPVAPAAPPSGLACDGSAGGVRWGAVAAADLYEVEAGLSSSAAVATPIASVTSATPSTVFHGLKAGQYWYKVRLHSPPRAHPLPLLQLALTLRPLAQVRAHGKGGSGIQTDVEWSDFSDPIRCTVAAPTPAEPPAEPAAAGDRAGASRFTLMYRVSEVWGGRLWGREYAPPDFLASHNSADGPGQASFLTFAELRSGQQASPPP
jgi:hypothetical protein